MKKVTIYTDGGAIPNPGAGGWAAILRFGEHVKELSGGEAHTTNNRMELTAALEALRALKEACEVDFYTDSQYLQKGISEWMAGWLKKGRLAPDSKNPVLNADLWRALHAETQRHRIRWHWVKGHAGNPDNERADELAGAEIQKRG
jgi:ribonuclease HI